VIVALTVSVTPIVWAPKLRMVTVKAWIALSAAMNV